MRASSDTIAQLAAAMAKAQSELVNPAKSLTAVLERGRNGSGAQSYRYAPLSSGLDIVRKTFGKYELAVIQTTHVDRERLLVHLTTTIAHSSGEWISALYPSVISPISVTLSLWGHCLPTPAAIAFSPWLAWRAKMTSMRRISSRQTRGRSLPMDRIPKHRQNAAPPYRSRKKVRATPQRLRLHRIWSLAAAGEGSREELGPPLPHLRDRGIQAAIWQTLRMRTRCFAGR